MEEEDDAREEQSEEDEYSGEGEEEDYEVAGLKCRFFNIHHVLLV